MKTDYRKLAQEYKAVLQAERLTSQIIEILDGYKWQKKENAKKYQELKKNSVQDFKKH